jgi:hypothetical protein
MEVSEWRINLLEFVKFHPVNRISVSGVLEIHILQLVVLLTIYPVPVYLTLVVGSGKLYRCRKKVGFLRYRLYSIRVFCRCVMKGEKNGQSHAARSMHVRTVVHVSSGSNYSAAT